MLNIEFHPSISKGYYKNALEAVSIGANTFQFSPRNPRGGKAKDLDLEDVEKLQEIMKEHSFAPLFVHGAYTMNLTSNKDMHEIIGEGTIGKDTIIKIINHPLLRGLPFNLETPNDIKGHKEEIKFLKSEYK